MNNASFEAVESHGTICQSNFLHIATVRRRNAKNLVDTFLNQFLVSESEECRVFFFISWTFHFGNFEVDTKRLSVHVGPALSHDPNTTRRGNSFVTLSIWWLTKRLSLCELTQVGFCLRSVSKGLVWPPPFTPSLSSSSSSPLLLPLPRLSSPPSPSSLFLSSSFSSQPRLSSPCLSSTLLLLSSASPPLSLLLSSTLLLPLLILSPPLLLPLLSSPLCVLSSPLPLLRANEVILTWLNVFSTLRCMSQSLQQQTEA